MRVAVSLAHPPRLRLPSFLELEEAQGYAQLILLSTDERTYNFPYVLFSAPPPRTPFFFFAPPPIPARQTIVFHSTVRQRDRASSSLHTWPLAAPRARRTQRTVPDAEKDT